MHVAALRLVPGLAAVLSACASVRPSDPVPAPAPLVISTDRPSFSDGTGIQPRATVNAETGWFWASRDDAGVDSDRHNGPEVLLRYGLIDDRLELRAIGSGYAWSRTDGPSTDSARGWTDPSLGLKWKALDQAGWRPRLALGAQTTLGVGARDVSSGKMEPIVKGLWSLDLCTCAGPRWSGWTLGGNLNAAFPTTSGERFTQGQASVYVAFPLRDRVTGFAEWFMLDPVSKGAGATHSTDFGAVWLMSDRVQADARVGFGLDDDADDVFAGVGVSFLF